MHDARLSRRAFLRAVGTAAAAAAAGAEGARSRAAQPASRPNIILVLTDDQGWTDTSVPMMRGRADSRSDFYRTPALERLAREGMVFSSAYAPAPVCSPTRDSILYGQTPARLHHAVLIGTARSGEGALSLPQAIKAADARYATAHFGKWGCTPKSPEAVGFDASDGNTDNWHGDWRRVDGEKVPLPTDDPKRIFSLTRRAAGFMEQQVRAGRPFYMRISHYACHVGHQSLRETREKVRARPRGAKCIDGDYRDPEALPEDVVRSGWMLNYAAMIEDLDSGLGMLLGKIDELGIADNTYVIFTSDNGGGFRGNAPLRGGKADLWEGGIRVPMVVRGPGVLPGTYCDVPVAGWDFWPTFRELAGGTGPLPANLDGGSLVPLFEKGNAGTVARREEALVFHFPWFDGVPESAIRLGRYKLMKNLNTGETRLFDLQRDIGETHDLSDAMPEKARDLRGRLTAYLEAVGAETIEENRDNRVRQLRTFQARDEAEIARLATQMAKAGESKRAELQQRIEQLQQRLQGHIAAMQRLQKGRLADW